MSGIFQRMSLIFRAKTNKALDKMEDPRQTLDYSYQRQLELLQKVRRGVADVATSRKRVSCKPTVWPGGPSAAVPAGADMSSRGFGVLHLVQGLIGLGSEVGEHALKNAAHECQLVLPVDRYANCAYSHPMCELGWKSLGVLELTSLPSIDEDRWIPWVKETDVLLVNGGDALYLAYWMQQSGIADLLPSLGDTVYVGFSAGSMVLTPRIGEDYVGWRPPTGDDSTLGIVDFSIFPHVDHPDLPGNTMAEAERWAAGLRGPAYAIDDATAIKVTDGHVELISEGHGNCSLRTTQRPSVAPRR